VSYISIEDSDACPSDFKNLSGNLLDFYSLDELGLRENNLYFEGEIEDFNFKEDFILIPGKAKDLNFEAVKAYTAYKKVDRKVKPVSGTFPQDALNLFRQSESLKRDLS